ncbi:MAG: hypothetical protein M9962_05085 [Oligoflexia bacterium]|nr:hypothetical protein [Oligoflexia bacterium]
MMFHYKIRKGYEFSFIQILFAVPLIIAIGCTKTPKAESPEGALQKYVQIAFGAKSFADKQKLAELSTGEALEYLNTMNEEDFKMQFLDSNLRLVSVKAKDKRQESDGDVSLVYELEYKDGKSEQLTTYSNKKIAFLTQGADGFWKIKATKNLKTFIEKTDDLVITPDSTN